VFVICSVACEYVSLRMDQRVCLIECFLSLLCSADEGEKIVWGGLCFNPCGSLSLSNKIYNSLA
jgi:hypothetical protein